MNILKALFGGKEETAEEKQQAEAARSFDLFKYDGVKALKMGRFDYAVKCFDEALKIKGDLEVRDYLAQALTRTGQLGEAYAQLQLLAEAEPENQAILLQMANVAYMMENYAAMAQVCEKAIAINKDNATALYLYSKACIGQGDVINAIAMLTKAITLQDDLYDAWLLRGQTLLDMGDTAGAEQDADHLMGVNNRQEDILMLKARVLVAKGMGTEAVAIYNKVIDTNPFCADAYKERGAAKYSVGDMVGAKEDAAKAIELNPEGMADVSGDYSVEGVEHRVRQAYSNVNPLGI